MVRIHDRQPVILPPAALDAWLDPGRRDAAALSDLLEPYGAEELEAVPIGRAVNRPTNDGAELLEPVGDPLRV